MPRRTRLLLAALALTTSPAEAQDTQLWLNTTLFGSHGRFAYFAEVQPRFGGDIARLDQFILRPAVGWKLDDDLTIYQGYARVENTPAGMPGFSEDRSFQQLSWEIGTYEKFKLSSRTRFEQRWQSDGRDTGFRFREMLRASHPIFDEAGGLKALGWSEVFVALNDTDWGARAGFDQIRTFVGLEIPIQDKSQGKSTFEIGYLNQTVNAPAAPVEVNHILSLNLFLRY
ncbi:MAG: DUF2490 domain-containing protein [Methylorubrum rhodinum]|uniref:DUF2490 domain-containing protein n=1 Tax=Methylorubrum rhodinum TaxID=29428 RepID=UPI003BAEB0DE